jgi:hypothetical protein
VPLKSNLRRRKPRDLLEERRELGFVRQPAVQWLSPKLLAKSGVEVVVSGTFGKFADKREIQRECQDGLDYSAASEMWIDYLSDTGDGFDATYTMAWLLAKEKLEFGADKKALPRGSVLLLGGDQVYPTAGAEAYEDRFKGPFAAASPDPDPPGTEEPDRVAKSLPPAGKPDLYALPGNHDWYDGLVSFLRVFCATKGRIGAYRTRQRRSYFAIKLAHGWWIWGIDIQLDTYIDDGQLEYFRNQVVEEGEKVVLLTAKPSWVKAVPGVVAPESWRYLSFFEERVVRAKGLKLVMTLTGDTHHYARFEPVDAGDEPTRVTAGGGGAYLSSTHTLKKLLDVLRVGQTVGVKYDREEQIYPSAEDSKKCSRGILKLPFLNPSFAALLGVVHILLGATMLGALDARPGALVATAKGHDYPGLLASAVSGMSIVLVVLLFLAIRVGVDVKPTPDEHGRGLLLAFARGAIALLQTAANVALAGFAVWLAAKVAGHEWDGIWLWLLSLLPLFAVGWLIGATVFGLFLFLVHRWRRDKAPENANTVFTGQSIPDFKNMLRMHFADDGGLTVYPLGVDRVGRNWEHIGPDGSEPQFDTAVAGRPAPHAIDVPLTYDKTGKCTTKRTTKP